MDRIAARTLAVGLTIAVMAGSCGGSSDGSDAAADSTGDVSTVTEPDTTEPEEPETPTTDPPTTTEAPPPTDPPARTIADIGHEVQVVIPAGDAYWAIGSATLIDLVTDEILAEVDWRAEFASLCGCEAGRFLGDQALVPQDDIANPGVLLLTAAGGDPVEGWLLAIDVSLEGDSSVTGTRTAIPEGNMAVVDGKVVISGIGDDGRIVLEAFDIGQLVDGTGPAPVWTAIDDTGGAGAEVFSTADGRVLVLPGKSAVILELNDARDGFVRRELAAGATGGTQIFSSSLAGARGSIWIDGPDGLLQRDNQDDETIVYEHLKPVGAGSSVAFSDIATHVLVPIWNFDVDPVVASYFYAEIAVGADPADIELIELDDGGAIVAQHDGTVIIGSVCIAAGSSTPVDLGATISDGFADPGGGAVILADGVVKRVDGCVLS